MPIERTPVVLPGGTGGLELAMLDRIAGLSELSDATESLAGSVMKFAPTLRSRSFLYLLLSTYCPRMETQSIPC